MEKFKSIEEIRLIPEFIGEAGLEKELKIDPEAMVAMFANEDLQVSEPFYIRYEVVRLQEMLKVYVDVKGEIHTNCARCLSPMTHMVDLHLKSDYMPAPPEMPDDMEAERQSEETGYYRKEIKLGEYIVSELVLSLPIIYICSPDCKGLCPSCGANLNTGTCKCTQSVDARLQGLSEIKNKLRK
jgi:uncharacterized metal-binding protein YceD (DUF177 family)